MPASQLESKGKKKKSVGAPAEAATTIHLKHEDGKHHVLGFWNLHVLIAPEGNRFFAQCQQIDYAAQGDTVEEAKQNFECGFVATVHHHIEMFGSVDRMLAEPCPSAEWFALLKRTEGMQFSVKHVSLHQILQKSSVVAFPAAYKGIDYAMGAAA